MSHRLLRVLLTLCLILSVWLSSSANAQDEFPVKIQNTSLVRGPVEDPSAVLWLQLNRALGEPFSVLVVADEKEVTAEFPGNEAGLSALVPVLLSGIKDNRDAIEVRVSETTDGGLISHGTMHDCSPPDRDWVLHFIPGFHYDPVWWNTQAHYTETGRYMDAHVGPGLTLVGEYLNMLGTDADYKVAFHQLPYLKTFLEAKPGRADELIAAIRSGRAAAVGGTYNELSTTLVSAESCARNAAYGTLFQREILGGSADVFWQCDVFGHDPSFPSLMAASGHRAGVFGRGPFHQWGAPRDQVNFPSEFLWMSPDGQSILTHYMTGHYGYAYEKFASGKNESPEDPVLRELLIAEMFEDLKRVALTHHVLLPMHMDFVRPLRDLGDVVREWNDAYLSPRAVIGTGETFFSKVREEVEERNIVLTTITRDMNPIYTGCPVSLADLKLAQRACEVALRDAEVFATVASLEGASYPSLALDRGWRQVLFNSHHDGVTGSQSDQVYLDTLASYRDALELATEVRDRSLDYLGKKVKTVSISLAGVDGSPGSLLAWNSLGHRRDGWIEVADERGVKRSVLVTGVPAVGYRSYQLPRSTTGSIASADPLRLENEHLLVILDPAKGGTIKSIVHKKTGREILTGPGNDVVLVEEYATLPGHGEGPWHLSPTGKRRPGTSVLATVDPIDPDRPYQRVITGSYPEFEKRQVIELLPGSERLEFTTEILNWTGRDQLLRIEFPLNVPGARPVFETAAAVIGRPFARDRNAAEDPWSLDQTCWHWIDLGTTCTVEVVSEDGREKPYRRALGVGEIVIGKDAPSIRLEEAGKLAEALVRNGVTTTTTVDTDRRYGDLAYDSNLPDFRIYLGTPGEHELLRGEDKRTDCFYLEREGHLPVLFLPPVALDNLCLQLEREHRIVIPSNRARFEGKRGATVDPFGVALFNAGSVSARVNEDSVLGLNLMRSSTGWPSGIWIDPPIKRLPDGAPYGTMHGSHRFRYGLMPHTGDYRTADLASHGQSFNHSIHARMEPGHKGSLPLSTSFFEVEGDGVLLTALKPLGLGEARWRTSSNEGEGGSRTVVVRLWNGSGRTVLASLRSRYSIRSAFVGNLLEERQSRIELARGEVDVQLGPHETKTLLLEVGAKDFDRLAPSLDPTREDTSPSAYWLENLGEGVTGNGILSVVPEEREVSLKDSEFILPVRVLNQRRDGSLSVQLTVESWDKLGIKLNPSSLEIPAGEVGVATLTLPPGSEVFKGSHLVSIFAKSEGRRVSGSVWIHGTEGKGTEGEGGPGQELTVETPQQVVSEGGALTAILRNHSQGPISCVATWLTPFRLFEAVSRWRTPVVLKAGESVRISAPVKSAVDSFALLKVTYGGRIVFGDPIAVTRDPSSIVLSFGVDRLRLKRDEATRVVVRALSLTGLSQETRVGLECPEGFLSPLDGYNYQWRRSGPDVMEFDFSVTPPEGAVRGTLKAKLESGGVVPVAFTVAPGQVARPGFESVKVDGDHSEWGADEFTRVEGPLSVVRTAVRYSANGLAFAVQVEDDRFVQTKTGAKIWEGDSMQFALSLSPSSALGYGQTDLEYGAALTSRGPVVWCWYAGEDGGTGHLSQAEIQVLRKDDVIFYEMRIPKSALPRVSLSPGTVLGFSYIANDDDGEGYRGATEWTPGMTGGKDSSLFGELVLEKAKD